MATEGAESPSCMSGVWSIRVREAAVDYPKERVPSCHPSSFPDANALTSLTDALIHRLSNAEEEGPARSLHAPCLPDFVYSATCHVEWTPAGRPEISGLLFSGRPYPP